MTDKKERQSYSSEEVKVHILNRLKNTAETVLRNRSFYMTPAKIAAKLEQYKNILEFVATKLHRDIINMYLEVEDEKGLYTDVDVYEVYLLRFIPEFDDLDFKTDCDIEYLQTQIKDLKIEKNGVKYMIECYDSDMGPPNMDLKEVAEAINKYNDLSYHRPAPIDVLVNKRENIAIKIKELLANEEAYIGHLKGHNRLKREIRKCKNRIFILKNRTSSS